ncbi:MAG: response regulator [Lentisphaerae bacterium]|nr:response regulator [Lentisphaerota bacterium]
MRILIVDDDRDLLAALKRVLDDNGHETHCADNARQAVEMAAAGDYRLLLVDYKMPEHDGIWFMQNATLPKESKVLLITAYVNREVINRMFDLGAAGYLVKPFDEDELLRHVQFYCGKEGA